MKHSITNDRTKKIQNHTHTGSPFLAWNLADCQYVAWAGDPFGISCFCSEKTFGVDFYC